MEPTFCFNEMSSARPAARTLQLTSCCSFQPALFCFCSSLLRVFTQSDRGRFPALTKGSPLIGVPARGALGFNLRLLGQGSEAGSVGRSTVGIHDS